VPIIETRDISISYHAGAGDDPMIPVKNSDKDSYRGERELNPFRQILTQCDGRQIDMVVSGTDQRPILIGDQHPSGMFDGDLRWADPDLYAKRCSAHQAFHSPQCWMPTGGKLPSKANTFRPGSCRRRTGRFGLELSPSAMGRLLGSPIARHRENMSRTQ
jgi:hypothetical protein